MTTSISRVRNRPANNKLYTDATTDSAVLANILTEAGVSPEKMDVQWFTDSNHNINTIGARAFLFKQLSLHLFQEKNRGSRKASHQWSKRAPGQPQRGGAQRLGLQGGP